MNENFDDLFDDFFKERKKTHTNLNDELKRIMETIMKFKRMDSEEDLENAIDSELGEPTEVEEFVRDGFIFKKLTWQTAHGKFVKVVVSELADNNSEVEPKSTEKEVKTIQEQLEDAVAAEDYALAIKLRDKINSGNNNF